MATKLNLYLQRNEKKEQQQQQQQRQLKSEGRNKSNKNNGLPDSLAILFLIGFYSSAHALTTMDVCVCVRNLCCYLRCGDCAASYHELFSRPFLLLFSSSLPLLLLLLARYLISCRRQRDVFTFYVAHTHTHEEKRGSAVALT